MIGPLERHFTHQGKRTAEDSESDTDSSAENVQEDISKQ